MIHHVPVRLPAAGLVGSNKYILSAVARSRDLTHVLALELLRLSK